MIYIILTLFLQTFCVYKIYDGSNLKSLSYTIDQNYDASLPVSMDYFDQEMISYYSWFASYGYCEDDQVDNWFYGLKSFTEENSVEFKIMSTNKFVINKIKYRMPLNLKTAIKEKKIKDENIIEIVNRIVKEKAFHKISFVKLILLYNKSMKI